MSLNKLRPISLSNLLFFSFGNTTNNRVLRDGSQWAQLDTTQTTKDDTYTYYQAKTTALSPFAISGITGGAAATTATPMVTETQAMPTSTETPAPTTTNRIPGFEFVLTVGILSAVYLFGRKRR
ncbi:MAG: PGF-pre-PGF domain-containing protein [Candidatus Methanoperedens sp.]